MEPTLTSGETNIRILLSSAADPLASQRYLETFRRRHPEIFARLASSASGTQYLIAVSSYSRFLSDAILQFPEWLESLVSSPDTFRLLSEDEFRERLEPELGEPGSMPAAQTLAIFRRRQLLRILLRDVMGHASLPEVAEEISNLADAILQCTYRRIRANLEQRYGKPQCGAPDGELEECGFSILALGKLGGRELNYSSDIDLMFVYSGNGHTSGAESISNKEFFKKVANVCTDLLSQYTSDGACYRVDLRLRPDGRLGEVCLSLDGARSYYETRARDWELQMLIKARVAAGEAAPGRQLLEFVEPRIYQSSLDFSAVEAVSVTRERIHEKASRRSRDTGLDIKLARGGIRDIEFLVQCLQRLHGGREPWVRHGGTMLALLRLQDKNLLSEVEYSRLAAAYEFLRHLEHRLQFLDDRQTHTLPADRRELETLARKMPATELGRMPSADKLLHQLNLHLEEVQETYDRVIHSQQPLYYSAIAPPPDRSAELPTLADPPASNLIRFLDQRAPELARVLRRRPLLRSAHSFEAFLERVNSNDARLAALNDNPVLAGDVIDIFENSAHFAEELIRRPELMDDLAEVRSASASEYGEVAKSLTDATSLRRFFRQEMFRIQTASICMRAPIFDTLERTSDLADAVICTAYGLACESVRRTHPPEDASYQPRDQMMVIALGRLGMREFDLGSDADLNFVIPDTDVRELRFWTRVAERMIDMITAYTAEGIMFAVDTRLRPNGREGTLVQTEASYNEYLSTRAEAWEGITYMKSRAVAGNSAATTRFLHELQQVDWRRYGQSGRSRPDLREMRARLEREQGASNPLKAGNGGYYDIDFAVMYLRLKSAGIFFKVLNTPERIDVIEQMGHLDRSDAEFLREAATFYRAVDHGLRVYSGHAEGRLPNSPAQLEALTALVHRWTPEHLHHEALPVVLGRIQTRTREYFRRLFG
ncbi:MAG TPA: glutamine-synthetase adenylyltransferase [Bryobacteraceae bacterium]|nr:glutamine-synthetase adenylyltransferase [Bryobacteraceae bacterium]